MCVCVCVCGGGGGLGGVPGFNNGQLNNFKTSLPNIYA